jgi:hypothetical protein
MLKLDEMAVNSVNNISSNTIEYDLLHYGVTGWLQVESSNINKIKFDNNIKSLYIQFHTNSIYKYSPITESQFRSMYTAPSKGKWFYANLRNSNQIICERLV